MNYFCHFMNWRIIFFIKFAVISNLTVYNQN